MHEKSRYALLGIAFTAILSLGVLHVVASVLYLYWTIGWFDNLMHFLGGLSIGLFLMWLLFSSGIPLGLPMGRPSLKMALTMMFLLIFVIGIGWEIFEYANGLTQSTESYPADVRHDLIADLLGGLLAGFIGSYRKLYL